MAAGETLTEIEFTVGEGDLNALVIHRGSNADQHSLLRGVIETRGNLPGKGEQLQKEAQGNVLHTALTDAADLASTACDGLTEVPGQIAFTMVRVGDERQDMEVRVGCGRKPEDCCKIGLKVMEAATRQK